MMDDTTVPTSPEHRQPRRVPRGRVDLIIGLVGTAAAIVAFTVGPLAIAAPAAFVMAAAGLALVYRNPSGEDTDR